jgi:hypothetical protein
MHLFLSQLAGILSGEKGWQENQGWDGHSGFHEFVAILFGYLTAHRKLPRHRIHGVTS